MSSVGLFVSSGDLCDGRADNQIRSSASPLQPRTQSSIHQVFQYTDDSNCLRLRPRFCLSPVCIHTRTQTSITNSRRHSAGWGAGFIQRGSIHPSIHPSTHPCPANQPPLHPRAELVHRSIRRSFLLPSDWRPGRNRSSHTYIHSITTIVVVTCMCLCSNFQRSNRNRSIDQSINQSINQPTNQPRCSPPLRLTAQRLSDRLTDRLPACLPACPPASLSVPTVKQNHPSARTPTMHVWPVSISIEQTTTIDDDRTDIGAVAASSHGEGKKKGGGRPWMDECMYAFIHSFIHSSIHPSIHPPIHPSIHFVRVRVKNCILPSRARAGAALFPHTASICTHYTHPLCDARWP